MNTRQKGFSVLTLTIILSVASVLYTTKMARTQLIDNLVLGNYYRNSEAFVNAESGINLVLSKLNSVDIASQMLRNLPFTYPAIMTPTSAYQVTITKLEYGKLSITSIGKSQDRSASRKISLQVRYTTDFNVPISPLSSNGKLNLDSTSTINDGCEGVEKADCRSPGNISEQLIVSQPGIAQEETEACRGNALQANNVDESAFYGATIDENGDSRLKEINNNEWGSAASSEGSIFDQVGPIEDMDNAGSLFESTFGVTLEAGKDELGSSGEVERIDMTVTDAISCSEQLHDIGDDTTIIYIKGDCNIDSNDASHRNAFDNNRFTIGSPEHPKMIFIEGGTFTTQPNTGASVIGVLYLLPKEYNVIDENGEIVYIDGEKQTYQDQSVDMGGIRVNGALLSEYNCSADSYDTTNQGTKQHFSARYDKRILNELYNQLGMTASRSHYQLVAGSWRDF